MHILPIKKNFLSTELASPFNMARDLQIINSKAPLNKPQMSQAAFQIEGVQLLPENSNNNTL